MRRFISVVFALLIVAGLTGCKKADEDVLHLGLNAIILGIYESELNGTDTILVEDIQLSTQRLK